MSDHASQSELMLLQAVRLSGVANDDAIMDRVFLPGEEVGRILTQAETTACVERFTFGDSSGWIITEVGSARLATLLHDEAASHDAIAVLERTLDTFEPLNEQLVTMLSQWQLQSTSPTTIDFGTVGSQQVDELLTFLAFISADLRDVLTDLTRVLPRFGRYPTQFAAAVDRARQDGLCWVTGVGLLSCHVVWAELHQDLLASLGRDRLDTEG